jgi:hypothetical protein
VCDRLGIDCVVAGSTGKPQAGATCRDVRDALDVEE